MQKFNFSILFNFEIIEQKQNFTNSSKKTNFLLGGVPHSTVHYILYVGKKMYNMYICKLYGDGIFQLYKAGPISRHSKVTP